MKRLVFSILLGLFSASAINAQQVFLEIRDKAQAMANDPHSASIVKDINRFKVDALNYMVIKMREQMPDSTAHYLDQQAYALHSFLSLYMKTMLAHRNDPQKLQVTYLKLFMDASYTNPLFRDEDQELVLAYFNNGECVTRFSLDTDWCKAYILSSRMISDMR